jgi:hypothetical protein
MKEGYKHNTSVFGNDSENYVASLFMMVQNPNGSRRPDLVSSPDCSFEPKLSIELKSGRQMKGVLVDYQLHYAATLQEDYVELFGEEVPCGNGFFPGIDWRASKKEFNQQGIAYYYDVVNRSDEMRARDVDKPFSSVQLRWGDQFIVPHEFGFYAFAIAKSMRTKEPLDEIMDHLVEIVKGDLTGRNKDYDERKKDSQSWQNIHGRDIIALFHDNPSLATPQGKKRIEMFHEIYPQLSSLKKIGINGPNNTMIYILADQEHENLFSDQLNSVVRARKGVIEEVTGEREEACGLLEKITFCKNIDLFGSEGEELEEGRKNMFYKLNISDDEVNLLKRLVQWLPEGEKSLKSKNVIPF